MTEVARVRERLLALLQRHCGIGPSPGGQYPGWLLSRVERAAEVLVGRASAGQGGGGELEEVERLAELVRVGETRFFRDPEQWQALGAALPQLLGPRSSAPVGRVRALSAGCSTGEEAWTLAMVLARAAIAPFRVLGVDRSQLALQEARAAAYAVEARQHVPSDYFGRYLHADAAGVQVARELQGAVSFAQRDLLTGPPPGSYEIIVCKNLLIYLQPKAADKLLTALYAALSPGGMLLVARAELGRVKSLKLPLLSIAPGVSLVRAPV